jgi:hypothetical protein
MRDSLLVSAGVQEWWKLRRSDNRTNFAKLIDVRLSHLGEGRAA